MSVSGGSGVSMTLVQPRIYRGPVAPTLGALGDIWVDTSAAPVAKLCTAVGPPATWTAISSGGAGNVTTDSISGAAIGRIAVFTDNPGSHIIDYTGSAGLLRLSAGKILTSGIQVALNSEVTGNLPVGNLNSGTSADNTHFWRGDGVWGFANIGTKDEGTILNGGITEAIDFVGAGVTATASGALTTVTIPGGGGGLTSLFNDFADVSNGTTLETDLYTHTLSAGQLTNNGDKLFVQFGGTATGNTNRKQIKLYFGGTIVGDSGLIIPIAATALLWDGNFMIMRVSSTVVRVTGSLLFVDTTLVNQSNPTKYVEVTGLTLSNTQIVKITGQSNTASNDVTAKLMNISYLAA